ncbi:hypothetical protein UFOVP1130_123 [uncultured Caudovirales phage]|uniref:Uncharacterized protein n=1 Tax=uncultured Caudovirales phage TaxID=2100421 RepID=A0A6J5R2D8_9CAUD|nr:hypothetical protein UFOVP1130_123 [uncultured Caudovirales phage]
MAKHLNNLNLNKNELQNAVIQNLATAPASPVAGQVYFDTVEAALKVYNGSAWEASALSGVTADAAELNILDGATLSTTELNYVDGVTSAIQGQLDAKAPLASPTFTGTVTLPSGTVTSAMIADGTIVNADISSSAAIADSKLATISTAGKVDNTATSATASAGNNTIVARDGSGNFAAGTITANLTGTASLATSSTTQSQGNDTTAIATTAFVNAAVTAGVNSVAVDSLDDISDVTITSATSGQFLKWNGTAWVNDAIDLGTDTTGSYVTSLVAGTGVTLSNNSGEGATPTIAIGQAVGTGSNVTFNDLTVSGNLTVSGTTTTVNTAEILLEDNIITLNSGEAGTPSANAGIEIERGTSANAVLRWNETTDKWQTTNDGTNYYDIITTNSQVAITEAAIITAVGTDGAAGAVLSTNGAGDLSFVTSVPVANGGTGSTTTSGARTSLGVAIGSDVQAYNATLAAVAGGTYSGDDSITTVGTITAGTWTGTAIAVANGGTGATTAPTARANLGATTKVSASVGNGSATSIVVTHSLNTRDLQVQLFEVASPYAQVFTDVELTTADTLTLTFSQAPSSSQYRVVIVG